MRAFSTASAVKGMPSSISAACSFCRQSPHRRSRAGRAGCGRERVGAGGLRLGRRGGRPSWRGPVRTAKGRCEAAAADGARRRCCLRRRGRQRARTLRHCQLGQRLFDRQQSSGLHQAHQADLQMEARLQRGLQIAEEIERELQIAREVLFGKLRRRSPPVLSRCAAEAAIRRASPRPRSAPPADCGNSATARG